MNSRLLTIVLVALAGCGGGGGSGGAVPPAGPAPVVYSGNAAPAIITATNASKLVANVSGGGADAAAIIAGLAVSGTDGVQVPSSGLPGVATRLDRGFRNTVLLHRQRSSTQGLAAAVVPIDETHPCDSGSVRLSGTVNDDLTGTLDVSYNDCRMGDDTLSGQATLRVDAVDAPTGFITDATFSFPSLTLRSPGVDAAVGGSLRTQLSLGSNTEVLTTNMVAVDNVTGAQTKAENLIGVSVYNNLSAPSSFTQTVAGRIYDSVHGFVDVSTAVPLVFTTLTQDFPDSGEVLLIGATNRSIRATAVSATLARLALDLDGNGIAELMPTLKWTELTGPIGSDLADNDGDGMHNSWETVYGLALGDPADAALDKDGDGFSNIAEYQAGSDPNNGAIIPTLLAGTVSR